MFYKKGRGVVIIMNVELTSVVVLSTSQRYTVIVWWLWPVVQNLHTRGENRKWWCFDRSASFVISRNLGLRLFPKFGSHLWEPVICVTHYTPYTHTHTAHTYRPLPSSVWTVSGDQERCDTPTPSPHSSEKTVERERQSSKLPTDDESCVCVCVCVCACAGGGKLRTYVSVYRQVDARSIIISS